MKETRGSFRPAQEPIIYKPYFKKGSFIASIVFLCLALTKISIFIGLLIAVLNKTDPETTHILMRIFSTVAMAVYSWITAIFSCITSFIAFSFGNSSRLSAINKRQKIATNIVTWTSLTIVIATAIPTILWLIFG